jgi:hypothetical protein
VAGPYGPRYLQVWTDDGKLLQSIQDPAPLQPAVPDPQKDGIAWFGFSPDSAELVVGKYPVDDGLGIAIIDVTTGAVKATAKLTPALAH